MKHTMKSNTRLGLVAVVATLGLATAACGTEQANEPEQTGAELSRPAPPAQHAPMSADAAERAAIRAEQERARRAERADALRWAHGHPTGQHYSGEEMWLPDGG